MSGQVLACATASLAAAGCETPRLDAEVLLAEAVEVDRLTLLARNGTAPSAGQIRRFEALVARRARREPVAYILGRRAFRDLELVVDPRVLVPRPETELLVEAAGRACYRSWEPGLNANVRRVRTDQASYFANILRSAHGSVLEHANYTLALRNVSRVFTHELVRHRAGSAFSQESLRYVRLTDIGFRVPPALEPVRDQVVSLVEQLEEFQVSAAESLGLDEAGVPFSIKKGVTPALSAPAPIGLSTDTVWTANLRTLRHVIEMRTSPGAEEELRLVFDRVAEIMKAEVPGLFQDFQRSEDGAWRPEHSKV